ncbi:MAG TPA: DUF2299 family protein [Candidatus Nitrosocosmicus sp.]|jgi:hypothetical protein|nr:DUF2299 family protein [Candidatus Nitrosocosmicus sp.]
MTNSNKERVYRTLLQWLKDYDYTIKEDETKKNTLEYYAKVFPPNEDIKFFEIVSDKDFKDGFLLRMSVAFTPKDRSDFEHLKEEAQNNLFIRMHKILSPIRLLCKIENSVISVEKFLFIDVDSIMCKQYFWDSVIEMSNAMYLIELTFYEFIDDLFPKRDR